MTIYIYLYYQNLSGIFIGLPQRVVFTRSFVVVILGVTTGEVTTGDGDFAAGNCFSCTSLSWTSSLCSSCRSVTFYQLRRISWVVISLCWLLYSPVLLCFQNMSSVPSVGLVCVCLDDVGPWLIMCFQNNSRLPRVLLSDSLSPFLTFGSFRVPPLK